MSAARVCIVRSRFNQGNRISAAAAVVDVPCCYSLYLLYSCVFPASLCVCVYVCESVLFMSASRLPVLRIYRYKLILWNIASTILLMAQARISLAGWYGLEKGINTGSLAPGQPELAVGPHAVPRGNGIAVYCRRSLINLWKICKTANRIREAHE